MSTDRLHSLASSDTPSAVTVPREWPGLLVWAVGRFGVGILVAAVFWHAWREERVESHSRNERLALILEQRARVDVEMTTALTRLTQTIEEMRKEAMGAHLRASNR